MNPSSTPSAPHGRGALGRTFANAGKLLGGKAAAGLIGLVYLSLAARTLGPTDFGLLVSVNFYALLVGTRWSGTAAAIWPAATPMPSSRCAAGSPRSKSPAALQRCCYAPRCPAS